MVQPASYAFPSGDFEHVLCHRFHLDGNNAAPLQYTTTFQTFRAQRDTTHASCRQAFGPHSLPLLSFVVAIVGSSADGQKNENQKHST